MIKNIFNNKMEIEIKTTALTVIKNELKTFLIVRG